MRHSFRLLRVRSLATERDLRVRLSRKTTRTLWLLIHFYSFCVLPAQAHEGEEQPLAVELTGNSGFVLLAVFSLLTGLAVYYFVERWAILHTGARMQKGE
jgi:Ni,Fe-hydrogenase I cytochrome b subunit